MKLVSISLALAFTALSSGAAAHAVLTIPEPLTSNDNAKSGPCGCFFGAPETAGEDNSPNPCPAVFTKTALPAGAAIEVEWKETVNHNGSFRLSFSSKSVQTVKKADLEGDAILYDQADTNGMSGATIKATIQLPDIDCPDCTLQLRQFMAGAAQPYYYSCASIQLIKSGGTTTTTTTTGAGGGDGGAGGATGDGGADPTSGNGGSGTTKPSTGPGKADAPPPADAGGCSIPAAPLGGGADGFLALALAAAAAGRLRRRAAR